MLAKKIPFQFIVTALAAFLLLGAGCVLNAVKPVCRVLATGYDNVEVVL